MFWVIVILPGPPQFLDRWSHSQPLIQWRIHSEFYDGELVRPCCSKAAPNHDTSTTMLHSWYQGLVLKCCNWFVTNMFSVTVPKKINFGFICPKRTVPEVLVFRQTLVMPWCFFIWQQRFLPCTPHMRIKLVQPLSDDFQRHFFSFFSLVTLLLSLNTVKMKIRSPYVYIW